MKPKKRTVRKGTFGVEVDGREITVDGKEVIKTSKDKTVVKFKARGVGEENPIKRISDKLVKKGGLVKKNRKKTVYKKGY
jgi:hypothetical protein